MQYGVCGVFDRHHRRAYPPRMIDLPAGLRVVVLVGTVALLAVGSAGADERPNRTASPVARRAPEAREAAPPAEAEAERRGWLGRTIDWLIPDTWPRLFPRRAEGEREEAAAAWPAPERERNLVRRTDPSARRNRTASAGQRPQMERVDRPSIFRSVSEENDTRPLWNRLTGWIPMPDTWFRPAERPAPTASTAAPPPARSERVSPQAYGAPRTAPPARAQASPTAPARTARLWVSPFMMRSVTPEHAGLGAALTAAFQERLAGRLADRSADAAYRLEGQYSVADGVATVTAYLRGARGVVRSFRWEAPVEAAAGLADRMIAEVEAAIPAR